MMVIFQSNILLKGLYDVELGFNNNDIIPLTFGDLNSDKQYFSHLILLKALILLQRIQKETH